MPLKCPLASVLFWFIFFFPSLETYQRFFCPAGQRELLVFSLPFHTAHNPRQQWGGREKYRDINSTSWRKPGLNSLETQTFRTGEAITSGIGLFRRLNPLWLDPHQFLFNCWLLRCSLSLKQTMPLLLGLPAGEMSDVKLSWLGWSGQVDYKNSAELFGLRWHP